MPIENAQSRFDKKWMPVSESGCWLWLAATYEKGYGAFALDGKKTIQAHRASWEIYRGEIPKGMCVLHKCDTPMCVNPDHLFLGDHQDNMDDMRRKGRGPVAEKHGRKKLTQAQVDEIRVADGTARKIAERYGVCRATIIRIRHCKNWTADANATPRKLTAHLKISDEDVVAIVSDTRSHGEIAGQYGIARCTVSLIKNGKRRAGATTGSVAAE